ncbi:hypothetical protein V6N13_126916 [Hibiscus sabdariffa]
MMESGLRYCGKGYTGGAIGPWTKTQRHVTCHQSKALDLAGQFGVNPRPRPVGDYILYVEKRGAWGHLLLAPSGDMQASVFTFTCDMP